MSNRKNINKNKNKKYYLSEKKMSILIIVLSILVSLSVLVAVFLVGDKGCSDEELGALNCYSFDYYILLYLSLFYTIISIVGVTSKNVILSLLVTIAFLIINIYLSFVWPYDMPLILIIALFIILMSELSLLEDLNNKKRNRI